VRGGEGSDRRTVWILQDEKPSSLKIKTGISDGSFTEVVEGDLKGGESVITDALGASSNLQNLRRGL
jgi:HlyD family secretion protein